MKNVSKLIFLIVIISIGIGVWRFSYKTKLNWTRPNNTPSSLNENLDLINHLTYLCQNNKTIEAFFYEGDFYPVQPGEPPIPSGQVKIILSDGRTFDLPQTISADGVRYANSDESFIFWSKGNGVLVLENGVEKNYVGCLALAQDSGGLTQTYLSSEANFSIRYPENYSFSQYQDIKSGQTIKGVKFTIPESLTKGTNLSNDSGVSVEVISNRHDCNASLFLDGVSAQNITDNGRECSYAFLEDRTAGNRYEEQIWVFLGSNSCFAVRYFIHYANLENYSEGSISEFDYQALLEQFDKIRQSLITR